MIDNFAIGLTHLLMALAAYRLLTRGDLDSDSPAQTIKRTVDLPGESPASSGGVRHV